MLLLIILAQAYNFFFEISSPLDQFEIKPVFSIEFSMVQDKFIQISFLNIDFYIFISLLLIIVMNSFSVNFNKIVSNNWSISQEVITGTLLNIFVSHINQKEAQIYFPILYSLFMFILINNLIGLLPYSFAVTAQLVAFALGTTVVLGCTLLGFKEHGIKFFSLFVPSGTDRLGLLPLLVIIETISYCARALSLGLRLGVNITSGHLLLAIFSGFTYKIMSFGFVYFILGLCPLVLILALTALEFAISIVQALVFVILAILYFKDALYLHSDDTK